MTYTAAYNFIISLHNVERQQYHADRKNCDWYLKRMQFFLDLLGNPEKKIPHYIHVTGTSGKGSVCLMLDATLRADGRRVGTLTSPHPSTILERWEVNGKPMSKKEFAALVTEMKPIIEKCARTTPYDLPSFSELMTAFGLYYFAKKKVRWAVIEVACGGRYDATNTIPHKDVAVITNIGWDHMDLLGNTKQKIAYEKAGIIKRGNLVFTQEKNSKVLAVIKLECRKQKAALRISNNEYRITNSDLNGTSFIFQNIPYHLPVLGAHQVKNATLCAEIARSVGIKEQTIQKGLGRLALPIRMEVVSKKPLIILDGAHNEDKMRSTISTIQNLSNSNGTMKQWNNVHLVVGFSANKDIPTMVAQLAALKPKTIACTRFVSNIFRKMADPKKIAYLFRVRLSRAKIKLFLDPREALRWSARQAGKNDLILATGSIFLSGDLRSEFSPLPRRRSN